MKSDFQQGATPSVQQCVDVARDLALHRVTRRQFIERAVAIGLSASAIATLIAACGDEEEAEQPTSLDTTLPETIYFFNWSDSIAPDVVTRFEDEYGISVEIPLYDSNEDLFAKLRAGATGYDVINPSDFMVTIMIKSGMLQPLDMSLIPNITNAVPALQAPSFDPGTDGKKYSVPYGYGSTAIAVRTDVITQAVSGWEAMWDPGNKRNIAMFDGERECLSAALLLLGYSPNTTDEAEIEEARDKLIEQKPILLKYTNDPKRDILQGVGLVHSWDGEVVLAKRSLGSDKVDFVLPSQGFMMFADGLSVPTSAPSPYAAHLLLNFLLEPDVAAANSNYIGYQQAAADLDLIEDPIMQEMWLTDAQIREGVFPVDLGEAAKLYQKAWFEVKSA